MVDGRSNRKAKVLPFISRIERDRHYQSLNIPKLGTIAPFGPTHKCGFWDSLPASKTKFNSGTAARKLNDEDIVFIERLGTPGNKLVSFGK